MVCFYKKAIDTDGVDAVFIFSDWKTHTEIAVYAMKKGIAVASEVGCEYSLENCFELVRVQEETGTPYRFAYNAFIDALKTGSEMPIDVYDAATWQAVSVLSEMSIKQGGTPQMMPDFTNGKWHERPQKDVCEL